MAWRVERAADADRDLGLIFDHLFRAALDFGEDEGVAFARAEARVRAVAEAAEALGRLPRQGTLRPDLGPGIRHVTKGRAVIYFHLDEAREVVRVLALFGGGQDHRRRMLLRLLGGEP